MRGHELHPAHSAGARDRQVGAVVGLDFVDRREDLPGHAVLGRGGLVDRQQEQGDAVEGERLGGSRRAASAAARAPASAAISCGAEGDVVRAPRRRLVSRLAPAAPVRVVVGAGGRRLVEVPGFFCLR